MTFADRIRSMTDEELASLIHGIASSAQISLVQSLNQRLSEANIKVSFQLVDFLPMSIADHLRALQQEMEEDHDDNML